MKKVVVIVGQTATGKSYLAVRLAKKLKGLNRFKKSVGRTSRNEVLGEVISADSRQVYKGIDIGTGKITKKEMRGVPHHLLDVANPESQFTVAGYKKLAEKEIRNIILRGHVPIICGGTGFYIDALTKGIVLPEVPPNKKLRKNLEGKSADKLYEMLEALDPRRARDIDPNNKVRLIRAIEVAKHLGKVPKIKEVPLPYKFIKIGVVVPEETLKKRIRIRLRKRIRSGMAVELYNLKHRGVPWRRFAELGFDQKYIALYLQGKMDQKEMFENLFRSNWQYAKRQMTWFKRDRDIKWFSPEEYKKIEKYIKNKL